MPLQNNSQNSRMPSKTSLMFNLLYSMIPLFGFWLVEKYWGLEKGILVAVALALIEVLWVLYKEHRFEPFATGSAILIIVMGWVSWKMKSSVVLKLKPAVFEGIFTLLFLISSLLKKPFMLVMARKQLGDLVKDPFQRAYLGGVNFRLGILFLMHTGVTAYAAIYLSEDAWFFVKGILFYLLFFLFFIFEFFYVRYSMKKHLEKMQQQQAFFEYQRSLIHQVRQVHKSPSSDD